MRHAVGAFLGFVVSAFRSVVCKYVLRVGEVAVQSAAGVVDRLPGGRRRRGFEFLLGRCWRIQILHLHAAKINVHVRTALTEAMHELCPLRKRLLSLTGRCFSSFILHRARGLRGGGSRWWRGRKIARPWLRWRGVILSASRKPSSFVGWGHRRPPNASEQDFVTKATGFAISLFCLVAACRIRVRAQLVVLPFVVLEPSKQQLQKNERAVGHGFLSLHRTAAKELR